LWTITADIWFVLNCKVVCLDRTSQAIQLLELKPDFNLLLPVNRVKFSIYNFTIVFWNYGTSEADVTFCKIAYFIGILSSSTSVIHLISCKWNMTFRFNSLQGPLIGLKSCCGKLVFVLQPRNFISLQYKKFWNTLEIFLNSRSQ